MYYLKLETPADALHRMEKFKFFVLKANIFPGNADILLIVRVCIYRLCVFRNTMYTGVWHSISEWQIL